MKTLRISARDRAIYKVQSLFLLDNGNKIRLETRDEPNGVWWYVSMKVVGSNIFRNIGQFNSEEQALKTVSILEKDDV